MVLPHLEYASAIWSPFLTGDKNRIEKVQKFALRMCTKCWEEHYDNLLSLTNMPSLLKRREVSRLCLLYKIIYGLCYFDTDCVFTPSNSRSYHSSHHLTLVHPFSHTSAYMHSLLKPREVPHLCLLYKIVHGLCYFDIDCVFTPSNSRSYHFIPSLIQVHIYILLFQMLLPCGIT